MINHFALQFLTKNAEVLLCFTRAQTILEKVGELYSLQQVCNEPVGRQFMSEV